MAGFFREHIQKVFFWETRGGKKVKRSKYWRKVRRNFLVVQPFCQNCGKSRKLQVHHIKPFHLYPHLELDMTNLITLCGNPRCHLDKGHLGHFKSYNENVIEDCSIWNSKYVTRP